jgi:hypothetical protein
LQLWADFIFNNIFSKHQAKEPVRILVPFFLTIIVNDFKFHCMKRSNISLPVIAVVIAISVSAFTAHKSPKAIGDYFGVTGMSGTAYILTTVRNTCALRDISVHCLSTFNTQVCIVKQVVSAPTNPGGYWTAAPGGFYQ